MSSSAYRRHSQGLPNPKPTPDVWEKATTIADRMGASEGPEAALEATERMLADADLSPSGVELWSWVLHIMSQRRFY